MARQTKAQLAAQLQELRQEVERLRAHVDHRSAARSACDASNEPSLPASSRDRQIGPLACELFAGDESAAHRIALTVLDALPLLAIVLDTEGRIVAFNRACENATSLRADEVCGRPLCDVLIPSDQRDDVRSLLARLASEGGSERRPCDWLVDNKRRLTLAWSFAALSVPQGSVRFIMGTGTELGELAGAATQELFGEERSRLLAENLPGVVYLCRNDEGYTVLYVNEAIHSLTGYCREDFLSGRIRFGNLIHRDDLVAVRTEIDAAIAHGRRYHLVYRIQTSHGQIRWVEEFGARFGDETGSAAMLEGFIHDITDRKHAEQALQTSESRFKRVVSSNMVGIHFWTSQGAIIDSNDAFLDMVGYTRDDLRAGRVRWDQMTPAEYRHLDDAGLEEIRQRGICTPFEKEYICKDGTRVPILIGAAAFEGDPAEGVCFVVNVSRRRAAEDALQRAYDELEERVAQRTAELQRSNQRLTSEIAQRREVEARLRRQTEILRSILNAMADAVIVADADGKLLLINPAGARLVDLSLEGTPPDQWVKDRNIHITSLRSPFPPDARPCELVLGGREVTSAEAHFFPPGSPAGIWISCNGHPMRDEQGRLAGGVLVLRDITERKLAEERVRQSESLYRLLAENSSDMISIHTVDWQCLYMSPACLSVIGFTPEQMVGRNSAEVIHPDDLEQTRRMFQQGLDEDFPFTLTFRARHAAGHHVWLESQVRVIRDDASGEVREVVSVTRDVTQRQVQEERLRASEERFRQIAEHIHEVFWIKSADGRQILYASPAFDEIWGRPREELYLRADAFLESIHPDDRPQVLAAMPRQREGGYDEQFRIIRPDGSVRHIRSRAFPVRGPSGAAYRIVGISEDITLQKQYEADLLEERRFLEHLIRVHERDRKLMSCEIHDGFVQQVVAANMHFDALDAQLSTMPDDTRRELLRGQQLLRNAIGEARRLISGLRPLIIDEQGIVAAIAHLIGEHSAEPPEIEFVHEFDSQRLDSLVESTLYRVVQEALANVRRHSQSSRARVSLIQTGSQLRLEVEDWGVGFEFGRSQDRCFGLRGIRQRARLLGGRAIIQSWPGRGTRITLDLPLAPRLGDR